MANKKSNKDDEDAYSQLLEEGNKLKAPETESARSRKLRILKQKSKELWMAAQ